MPSSPADTVAFIGLGVMGYPMAKNLLSGLGREKTLLICDVSAEALDRFTKEAQGQAAVEVISNGFEATKVADTVITMLPGSDAVKTVYLDPETGILAGAVAAASESGSPSPKLIMECGTIETDTIFSVAKATQEVSASKLDGTLIFVDAPVSGGPMGAEAGTLTFMVGCLPAVSETVFPIVKSYLKHMGREKDIYLCGDVGAGTAFKIINNYLSAITSLAASEALNIGTKAGLDAKLLTDVINASGGQCWVTSKSNPVPGVQENVPSSRDYNGGFRIELCAKVLGMGSKLAKSVGARTMLDGPTLEAFHEAMGDERYRGKDARVVYNVMPSPRSSLMRGTRALVHRAAIDDPGGFGSDSDFDGAPMSLWNPEAGGTECFRAPTVFEMASRLTWVGNMNTTTYNTERKTASIQPGCRWKPVFETLAEYGVAVTGGRDSDVGVGGFILGGGNSFWSASHGWACDNVVNFEVVLADGCIINANAEEHSDFWAALKGGSGNFGIVTRFDMKTIEYANPQNHIYGGAISYPHESTKEAIAAFVDFADSQSKDVANHAFMSWAYIPGIGTAITSFVANVLNDASTSAFDGIVRVPGMTGSSLRSAAVTNFTDEIQIPKGYRHIWETGTYKNDARVIQYAVDKFNDMVPRIEAAVSSEKLLIIVASFQPLTQPMISQAAASGGNMLGLEERVKDGNGVLFNAAVVLSGDESEEAAAIPLVHEWLGSMDGFAREEDLGWDWRYLNYANGDQDPIASYGLESVQTLRAVAVKYDPQGVFQRLRRSGFKIPI
ncbi:hypothetical protein O1611_g8715 [Lasiodiplodia mahajangana]|uniref:Uncharacterized protein n=1 Tax=Lasiodiplodia mahajangana TaxID=1108764 RepID=A0ACC2JBR0_9PEZI|nr:hypothetical protein O1611_g8715 [Lasiodiplodia mahajangana]